MVVHIGRHHLHCVDGLWYVFTPGIGVWAFDMTYEQAVQAAETVQ